MPCATCGRIHPPALEVEPFGPHAPVTMCVHGRRAFVDPPCEACKPLESPGRVAWVEALEAERAAHAVELRAAADANHRARTLLRAWLFWLRSPEPQGVSELEDRTQAELHNV